MFFLTDLPTNRLAVDWFWLWGLVLAPGLLHVNSWATASHCPYQDPLQIVDREATPATAAPATSAQDDAEFDLPIRLTVDGRPIEVELPGYACPTMVDFEGQGKFDLVVGQFANGNMLHFPNESRAGEPPRFSKGEWLKSGNGRLAIPGIRCCTSSTPQFVDFNGDGRLDILSGCYATPGFPAGHIMLLIGQGERLFSNPIYLSGSSNQRLQNVQFNNPVNAQQALLDSVCTHQHAVDLDQDGDLDLVVGSASGRFFHYKNIGTAQQPLMQQPPSPLPIQSPASRSAPHLVDWNGDGLLDLLTGGSEGGVYLSLNQGTAAEPVWSEFSTLIAPTQATYQVNHDSIQPGHSWRLWVCDWNLDGKLDLVVGDCVSLLSRRPEVTETVFRLQANELRQKSGELNQVRFALHSSSRANPVPLETISSRSELEQTAQRLASELKLLESRRHQWATEKKTGFVWLYLRK